MIALVVVLGFGGIKGLGHSSERRFVCSGYVLHKALSLGGGSNTSNGDGTIGGEDDVREAQAAQGICPTYITANSFAGNPDEGERPPPPPTPKGGPEWIE